jgi:hypothetical protein
VKLIVSALLVATASAVCAQSQSSSQGYAVLQSDGAAMTPQQKAALQKAQVDLQTVVNRMSQTGCPLYMESASVAPGGGYLPVTAQNRQEGALDLHFRNQSGKAIASASITTRVNVKTNVYALDAHPLELRLKVDGTQDLDKTLDQMEHIVLPAHVYLFGVAHVTLNQVAYADGTVWTAPATNNGCQTAGGSIEHIAQ